jgi:hypothetical protein
MKSPSPAGVEDPTDGVSLSDDPATDSNALLPNARRARVAARIGVPRAGALTGLAGAVLYLAGALLPGAAPKPDAATSQVIAFFVDKRGSLLTGFTLELVAVGLLLCFLGYLRGVIVDAQPGYTALATSMVAAWVVTIAIAAAGTLPAVATIWRGAPGADPTLTRFAYDIETLATYAITSTAALVSIGAPSVVIWRTGVLPRWLSVLGAAEIAVNVAELFGLSSRHGALAGGYAFGVGPLLWIVWFAAASACLALKTDSQRGASERSSRPSFGTVGDRHSSGPNRTSS